ncbi:hypothetical protein BJ878DRAFT_541053 [Calycina marina]|uniref:Uncharacterized protein n=1 Tax=Calycina marina TaxID=1763456 RepID=A0A9P7Z5B1_9HELO|nr:hypothetical protein BJ878DRAFT_541053 [Calycina marina]
MATQEELASLFARNLSFNPYVAPSPPPEPAPEPETPYVYSISQHYHHSAHLVAPQPPQTDLVATEIILGRHGIDYATLFPSQIDLFTSADASQRMRLIELWRICPPNYGGQQFAQDLGPATTLQQEEALAKFKYERQMLEERMSRTSNEGMEMEDSMSDSSSTPMPMTPIQGGDGRWSGLAEPHMTSGYEALAKREYERSAAPPQDTYSHFSTAGGGPNYQPSTDPVYNSGSDNKYHNVGGDLQKLIERRQQAMEDQYGAYQQRQHYTSGVVTGEDEEML